MNLSIPFNEVFCARLVQSLAHFLWQGIAIALLAALALACLRRTAPQIRYNLLVGALVLMALCPVGTFLLLESPTAPVMTAIAPANEIAPWNHASLADGGFPDGGNPPVEVVVAGLPAAWSRQAGVPVVAPTAAEAVAAETSWHFEWQRYAPYAVLAYLAGVAVMLGRLGLAVRGGQRLRRQARPVEDAGLLETVARRAKALGLAAAPVVAYCGRIAVPTVVGVLRPAILLPLTFDCGLTLDQIEALLTHELAHIRRYDHLVNLGQRVIEALFFFHPAVWLLSRQIRLEREHCCDDVVLAAGGRVLSYADSLVRMAELSLRSQAKVQAMSLSAAGKVSQLRGRILRLIEGPAAPPVRFTRMGTLILGIVTVVALALALYLPGQAEQAQENAGPELAKKAETPEQAVTGQVVDADGKPLKDVKVCAFDYGEAPAQSFRTDADGKFQVPHDWLGEDAHHVLIVRPGADRLGWYTLAVYNPEAREKLKEGFRITVLPRGRVLQATLVDVKGKPLAKVPVKAQTLDGTMIRNLTGEDPLGETVTDERGHFTLKVPESKYGELVPVHPRYIRKRLNFGPNKNDLGTVAVAEAGSITGRVTDARTGQPVVGATIGAQTYAQDTETGGFGDARTDVEGRYTIPSMKPGTYNVLFSSMKTNPKMTAAGKEAVRVEAGKEAEVNLVGAEGRLLSGSVVTVESNAPLANCHVGYYGAARPRSGAWCMMVRTDARGRFHFHVPPGTSYVYVAEGGRSPGDASSRTLIVPADRDPPPVVLKAFGTREVPGSSKTVCVDCATTEAAKDYSYTLRGSFRTRDGRPVTHTTIWMYRKGSRHFSQTSYRSGNEFEVPVGKSGEGQSYQLVIEAAGFARPQPYEFVGAKEMKPAVINLEPATFVTVRGRVVDPGGQPIAGALVRAALWLGGIESENPWGVEPSTDEQGRFELNQLRVGDRFSVQIGKKGYAGAALDWMRLEKPETVELPAFRMGKASRELTGTVTDPAGKPVKGVHVIYNDLELRQTTTDAKGVFHLRGLPDGKLRLNIEAPGFERWPHLVPANVKTWKTELRRSNPAEAGYQLKVHLRTQDGKPVTRSTVWVGEKGQPRWSNASWPTGNDLDLGGEWWLSRYEGKTFYVLVEPEGYRRPRPIEFAVHKDMNPLTIDLEPAISVPVRGRVLDTAGKPIAGARVGVALPVLGESMEDLVWESPMFPTLLTDTEGRFDVKNLKVGSRFVVHVAKAGYAGTVSGQVMVEKAGAIELPDLRMGPATGEIAGTVVDPQGKPLAGVTVYASDFLVTKEAKTDAHGMFHFEGLPDGPIRVHVDVPEYAEWYGGAKAGTKDLKVKLRAE